MGLIDRFGRMLYVSSHPHHPSLTVLTCLQMLHAHPSSVLFTRIPKTSFVIYHEVIETTKRFMRDVSSIEQDWLPELAPHYYSFSKEK